MDNVYESIEHRMYDEHGDEIYKEEALFHVDIAFSHYNAVLKDYIIRCLDNVGIKFVQSSLSPAGEYMLFFSGDEKNGDKKV